MQQPSVPSVALVGGSSAPPPYPTGGRKRSFSVMCGEEAEEALIRKVDILNMDQSKLQGVSDSSVAIMVAMKEFLNKLCKAVPKGLVSPVSELVVSILHELVVAPPVITPLIALLPPQLMPVLLSLHPPATFTPCHLLSLALPQVPPNIVSPFTPDVEAKARRSAAKLLCTHRNLLMAANNDNLQSVLG